MNQGPPAHEAERLGFTFQEIERVSGARTLPGNRIRLQFEGPATFERWLEVIDRARLFVYFENYVVRDDRVGRAFREALIAKARQGVPVFLVYDWLGCWATPRRYWRPYREAGVHVRAFNRPHLGIGDPFGILQRDHRKVVAVDGTVAFVGGFCVGDEWAGTATRPPWRDTGVEIHGPAALEVARAFERLWDQTGEGTHLAATLPEPEPCGDTPAWVIEGEPGRARVYRTFHLAAVRASERIWITDAYFVAPRSLTEALTAAARQGVDVRILVPANNNWPWVGTLSRGGYRGLLEHGVRVFEWQGPMIHAKTAVVDQRWSRVGSSNLNAASLMGNWEIDVGVLDRELADQLGGLFLADLASSVEIVLPRATSGNLPRRVAGEHPPATAPLAPEGTLPQRLEHHLRAMGAGGAGRLRIAPFVRAGVSLGDALAGNRPLGREERTALWTMALTLLMFGALAAFFPTVVGWTLAVAMLWFGGTTAIRAYVQYRRERVLERQRAERPPLEGGGVGADPSAGG